NVANRLLYACRVVRKARANNMTVAVWTRDAHKLDFFARQLWSFEPTGFYPHVAADDELAAETPIVYHTDEKLLPARDVLILLDDEVPDDWKTLFDRFGRVIDIVGATEAERLPARQRFKTYRAAGLSPIAHDQGAHNA
ncbi:MAG TPA: DNA polymerase III subunit chi, partial [Candidatus Aphodousia faecigallinarum]|nr:DNA polymerase III subunit chi [Candidatus Aphodousia faecigallinarum]